MSISSSLNAGVAGLAANATKLSVISDNIANSSTFGYKRSEADFHSMVVSNSGGKYTAGGVRVTTQKLIDESGPLISTSNSTDLAIRGRGMLPVTSETDVLAERANLPLMLSTTGSFRTDADGYLKSPTGLVLMGWPANPDGSIPAQPRDTSNGLRPVQINTNDFTAEPTTRIALSPNLPASSTQPGSTAGPESLSIEYFGNLGFSQVLTATFTPDLPAAAATVPTNSWTLELTDSAGAGATVGRYTLTFNDDRTNGGTLASVTPLQTDPLDPASPMSPAYDLASGEVQIVVGAGTPPDPANTIDVTLGVPNAPGGIGQLGDAFAPGIISKDGATVGNLLDVEVDSSGFVNARFDTGLVRRIFQVPLVDVPNPNGLVARDNQTYQISKDSGPFFLWDAGDGPTGDVMGFSREESTTDVANELTQLIKTQRAYSSNAKVIQTVDEMLQETTNIKR